ncbi:MAG: NAD(P)H-dependent oxidoreductase [Candidatus Omnitrophota bacterium]|nr:MAG: NAD(P)H-dependent oxidoreductase [Candidatus Omnitrophota bacterium]
MAKVLIAYYSSSGNTKKMAEKIAETVKKEEVETVLKKVEHVKASELTDYDGIVMGSPTYYGTMAWQVKKLLDESVSLHGSLKGKIGGAFSSAANIGGGNETTITDILNAMLIHGMIVQGEPNGDHYGPVAIGAPDSRALKCCERLGKNVANLAKKLF